MYIEKSMDCPYYKAMKNISNDLPNDDDPLCGTDTKKPKRKPAVAKTAVAKPAPHPVPAPPVEVKEKKSKKPKTKLTDSEKQLLHTDVEQYMALLRSLRNSKK